jgi:hypothetical protein
MPHKDAFIKYLISFTITIVAALSGYYAAYTGLRVELATKAEARYVDGLDIRLARLETTINERFATKDDFAAFKGEVMAKLVAIETVLSATKTSGYQTTKQR